MKKDNALFGVLVCLGSIIVTALVVIAVFVFFKIPFMGNMKYFLAAFVPAIVLLRYYAKNLQFMHTSKAIMITLSLVLVAFIVFLVRSKEIALG
ncbi:MAG: hypothetical protein IJQ89_12080 [Bacteroidales bacterium]|nr:hypothetical protein [Bacteroidales bacterium]